MADPVVIVNAKDIPDGSAGITGYIDGIFRQTYWTPDGRTFKAIPNMRDFVRKDKDGKVVGQGIRDANLDKGWLLTKPDKLKIHCLYCAFWHDNEEEVEACKVIAEQEKAKVESQTSSEIEEYLKQQKVEKDTEISSLKKELKELKDMMKAFMRRDKPDGSVS